MCTGPSEQGGVLLDLDGVTLQTPDGASTLVQNLSVKVWLSCLATCFIFPTAIAMRGKEFAGHIKLSLHQTAYRLQAYCLTAQLFIVSEVGSKLASCS